MEGSGVLKTSNGHTVAEETDCESIQLTRSNRFMSFVSQYFNYIVPAIAIIVGLWFLSRPMGPSAKNPSVHVSAY